MKKTIRLILCCLSVAAFSSCLGEYLDKAPDSGLSEEEVFSKYANFKKYFYSVYYGSRFNVKCHYPMVFHGNNQKMTLEALTDMCDMSRIQRCQPIKQGDGSQSTWAVGYNTGDSYSPNVAKVPNTMKSIRVCNTAISKIGMLQDASESEKNDIVAQAYFLRGYCHLELFRLYGSFPYIDKVLGADDEWDMPAEEPVSFLRKCADDFQTAYDYFVLAGKIRRDPAEGAGNLADPDQDKPCGVTALAFKGRALLYAASPLNNASDDKSLWEEAAEANATALNMALQNGYKLLPFAQYTNNFYGTKYTNEQLWAYSTGSTTNYKATTVQAFIGYPFTADAYSSAQCPTQNFVDMFETAGGYPLNTEAQRAAAVAAGQYDDQDPFGQADGAVKRDPRFYKVVIYNGRDLQGYGAASLYVNENGSLPSGSLLEKKAGSTDGVSETFYYENKRTGNLSNKGNQNVMLTDPILRLAEVYLNYAEAANEAYGPQGKAPSASMTALEALNAVRARAEMPPVLDEYTSSADALRPRIKNERAVELCFEGYHYYCDIRRWKDAPSIGRSKLYGLRVVKLSSGADATHPTGYRYERFELPSTRQIAWKNDGMYYFQFQNSDLLKMKNYTVQIPW
ncbi:MAG: RagB/SusD family nutrient uptake outer membrane protein [Bacteroidales bacterium]|nr:RagB/SusD family nutrient uptake outer membrane protein [Bacteroidales bacterium]